MSTINGLTNTEKNRYARHLSLTEIGQNGQLILKRSSVIVVGAGGLGSPVLSYLAAAGVGRLGVVDFDRVDQSNLQRQILHGESFIGELKTESAKHRLSEINPLVQIEAHTERLNAENALDVLKNYDVIVDGTDNFPTRYLLNDAAILLNKPLIYGSIYTFEGQVSVFNHKGGWLRPNEWDCLDTRTQRELRREQKDWVYDLKVKGPSYRDLYPEPPPPELSPNCGEAGVLGVLPAVIGSLQATETLKVLLGIGRTLSGRILCYDALEMTFREFKLARSASTSPIESLIDYVAFCGGEVPFQRLSVEEIVDKRNRGWTPFVLDVRSKEEATKLKLSFSDLRKSPDELASNWKKIPRDRDILCHCKSGRRSEKALKTLSKFGFDRLFNMEGGIEQWKAQRAEGILDNQ